MAGINIKLDVDCQRDNYPAENIAISLVIICIYKSYMGENIHLRIWQTNNTHNVMRKAVYHRHCLVINKSVGAFD